MYCTNCTDTYYVMRFTPGDSYSSSTLISTLVSTVTPPAFAISPSGSRIFSVQQDAANVVAWTMVYLSGGYYAEAEPVLVMSGFGAEYFACGDQVRRNAKPDHACILSAATIR